MNPPIELTADSVSIAATGQYRHRSGQSEQGVAGRGRSRLEADEVGAERAEHEDLCRREAACSEQSDH